MPAFFRNLFAFVVIVILIHLMYAGYIRPQAELVLEAARQAGQSLPRNIFVILKDLEQEVCLMLMCFGIWLMGDKYLHLLSMQHLFDVDILKRIENKTTATGEILDELEKLPEKSKKTPLIYVLTESVRRYRITNDVQNTSDAISSGVESQGARLEAENSMIRYLIWAIPSIGFIGTVRGIGQALSQADKALAGDIAEMTGSLGVAFNSTLVALLISIFLMFVLHQLQRMQDGLLIDIQAYCEKYLLNRISK